MAAAAITRVVATQSTAPHEAVKQHVSAIYEAELARLQQRQPCLTALETASATLVGHGGPCWGRLRHSLSCICRPLHAHDAPACMPVQLAACVGWTMVIPRRQEPSDLPSDSCGHPCGLSRRLQGSQFAERLTQVATISQEPQPESAYRSSQSPISIAVGDSLL